MALHYIACLFSTLDFRYLDKPESLSTFSILAHIFTISYNYRDSTVLLTQRQGGQIGIYLNRAFCKYRVWRVVEFGVICADLLRRNQNSFR